MILVLVCIATGLSQEVIVQFNHYKERSELYQAIKPYLPSETQLLHSGPELSRVSDFLVLNSTDTTFLESFEFIQGVYSQKLILKKPLYFSSSSKGSKLSDLFPKILPKENHSIAILDSGFNSADLATVPVFSCVNFTTEPDCEDLSGHGTYIASLILSKHPGCPGMAPNSKVYSLKVFTSTHTSYTSWFLEAFNFILTHNISFVNLSTGGIDFSDQVFVEKVKELVERGVTVFSAVGNDGPGWGTLNNPADQPEVIGVGSLDAYGSSVADFSSRGPTLWELTGGMGRTKPDLVTYGTNILGFFNGKCLVNSGTSVATPIVAGAVLLISNSSFSPGHIKNSITLSADKLFYESILEQGAGKLHLEKALQAVNQFSLVSFPKVYNANDNYFFPFNLQPMYPQSPPFILNITLTHPTHPSTPLELSSISVSHPSLEIQVETPTYFSAYSACASIFASLSYYEVEELRANATFQSGNFTHVFQMKFKAAESPLKSERLLWDLSHSMKFPEDGNILRDDQEDMYFFDWRGDHPYTNYLGLYESLVSWGYAVDFLYHDYSCVDSQLYGYYLVIDPEVGFGEYEAKKLKYDIEVGGLELILVPDWSDLETKNSEVGDSPIKDPYTGSDLHFLNDFLSGYFVEFSTWKTLSGSGSINGKPFSVSFKQYLQGTEITRFPAGGYLVTQKLYEDYNTIREAGVLGLTTIQAGKLAVWGDSSCLDQTIAVRDCLHVLKTILLWGREGVSVDEVYQLPYDYDIHREEEPFQPTFAIKEVSLERKEHLKCQLQRESCVEEHVPYKHEITNTKLREWNPFGEKENLIDLVTVVQILSSIILFLLIFSFFMAVKRRRRLQEAQNLPISISTI